MRYLIAIIILFTFVGISFSAKKLEDSNCKNIESFKIIGDAYDFSKNKLFKKEVYDTALKNLRKYCNKDIIGVLPSDILANHLIDVGFRILDGFGGKYSYGLEVDDLAKSWRDYLNNIMEKYETKPQEIKDKFEEIWGKPEKNYKPTMDNLYGRYLLFCQELEPIYDKIIVNTNTQQDSSYSFASKYVNACKNLAQRRYVKESYLVNRIMFMNLYNHINKTLYKGFTQEFNVKWTRLYDKFLILLGNYEYVVRRFIHATDVNTR